MFDGILHEQFDRYQTEDVPVTLVVLIVDKRCHSRARRLPIFGALPFRA